MSRSGYSDCDDYDGDNPSYLLWPSIVRRATKGKRGQAFLQELAAEMDAMPEKCLIKDDLVTPEGACCAIGVIYKSRGISAESVDVHDPEEVAQKVNIARALAAHIEYENDEAGPSDETPEQRWIRMRKWVAEQIGEVMH